MPYLTEATEIKAIITELTSAKIIWADTEIADWNTDNPRLSLIQVLADPNDRTGKFAYILDVLDKPELATYFVNQIMANPEIEKVFHNAVFDLKYLGKEKAINVTCTYKLAQKISRRRLQTSNLKLKTLAAELCQFSNVDSKEQASDWGRRPLTKSQLKYAQLDPVYLAWVHRRLLNINNQNQSHIEEGEIMPPSDKISVTKVRVAFECPRLFYLKQHFNGNTQFIPGDRQKAIGTNFHKLAANFINIAKQEPRFKALFSPPAEQLKAENVAMEMQKLFYELVFYPYLQTTILTNPNEAAPLHQIWQGLTKLIRHWSELLVKNRRYCNADTVINRTLVIEEFSLEYNFTLPDNTQQKITGILDSLVFDFEKNRFCVVDYKTYHPVDPSAQLAQVALYSYMLKEQKNLPVDSAVYCVLPEFKEYHYTWEQLENTVHSLIPHKLQQMRQWLTWEPPHPNPPLIAPQAGYVSVDLPRSDRQIAPLDRYIQPQQLPPTAPIKIAIGINLDGKLVEADLSDPNTCHFLVGGTTGSGKSEFLRSLLLSLLLRHSHQNLKIALVDPKRVTFPEFEAIPWLYAPIVKDSETAIDLMSQLVSEMEQRYHLFERSGCADISAYNQKVTKPLPRVVCIFDEYADFMAEKEIRNALELSVKRLGAMARAAGIHLIVATQRPEAKVVTPLIRSNLPGRVALRTASEADSIIVLGGDEKAAAYLLGKGDLLYQVGANLHRLQSLLATIIKLTQN